MSTSPRFLAAVTLIAAGTLAACADTTGTGGSRPVSLSFSTGGLTPAASAARFAVLGAPDPLVITRAQVVLSKSELERAGVSCVGAVEADEDSCPDLKFGPMLIDLPVDASARTALTVTIPAGTYDEFETEIDAISSENEGRQQESAAFLAANPNFRGVSIRVEGTYNGVPFVYTTGVEAGLELSFSPPMVVDGASNNLTVHVDMSKWFLNGSGLRIDPRTANAGGANKSLVDENIKRSFDVFEDDDRDGRR